MGIQLGQGRYCIVPINYTLTFFEHQKVHGGPGHGVIVTVPVRLVENVRPVSFGPRPVVTGLVSASVLRISAALPEAVSSLLPTATTAVVPVLHAHPGVRPLVVVVVVAAR